MSSKFIDTTAIMQVIGCIYKHPYLLEQEDKYFFHEEDFTERFHQTLFGSIYNLKMLGANKIDYISLPGLANYESLINLYSFIEGKLCYLQLYNFGFKRIYNPNEILFPIP